MTLDEFNCNEQVVIKSINLTKKEKQRLFEMGLVKGSKIKILHKGLFNDPIEIVVLDYRMFIRIFLAKKIEVER